MRKFLVVIIFAAIFVAVFYLWWQRGISSVNPKDTVVKLFVIPKGAAIRAIGNELRSQGLIKDPVVFFLYIKQNGLDKDIQAGSYRLSPSMNLAKIMDTLGHGTLDVWVTIPEGLRAEEVAKILSDSIPSYRTEWKEILKKNEGYLFPDTYLIPKDADVEGVISILRSNFNQKIDTIGLTPTSPNLLRVLTIASLIEREAKFAEDRPYVSSVIENRLSIGMALQIDATAQYAYGYNIQAKTWWKIPSRADIKINSSYNTYINTGLPPQPICNPGLESIKAALSPAKSNYIYYVNDSSGKLHFAENLTQHNKNIQKYLN
jgi:UPF0755 protein